MDAPVYACEARLLAAASGRRGHTVDKVSAPPMRFIEAVGTKDEDPGNEAEVFRFDQAVRDIEKNETLRIA